MIIEFYRHGLNRHGRQRAFMACCDMPEGALHHKHCREFGPVRDDRQWWDKQSVETRLIDMPESAKPRTSSRELL